MTFTTFDMEFADVIIPSICSISIIDWNETGMIDCFSKQINPDCNIEEFLEKRHKINAKDLVSSPVLPELWMDIYDRLENKIVFSHYANRNFTSLKNLTDIDYLNMPPFIFACSASISRKLWPYFNSDSLPVVSERLGITEKHFNSFEDAKSVGFIVNAALRDTRSNTISDLFRKIGFSGGYIQNGEKHIYRAIKRDNNYLIKAESEPNNISISNWDDFYSKMSKTSFPYNIK